MLILFIIVVFFYFGFDVAYCEDNDGDKSELVKGTIEVNNTKIDLDNSVKHVRDGAIFVGGITAGAKLLKNTSLPIGAKLGATIGMGAASLVGFNLTQKTIATDKKGKVQMEIGNISGNASLKKSKTSENNSSNNDTNNSSSNNSSSDNGSYPFKSSIEDNESNNTTISDIIELLNENVNLHLIIIYLIVMLFIFIFMKNINDKYWKFPLIKKLPYGHLIEFYIMKLLKMWSKINNIWIYLILSTILLSNIISLYSLYVIIDKLG